MPTYADLIEVAYNKERVHGRRLAKQLAILEESALQQVMESVAGDQPLNDLVGKRRQAANDARAKITAAKQAKADARAKKIARSMPDPNAWLAWFDGATHPNPGKMGIGGLLKNPDGDVVSSISYTAGQGDSSEAEYLALLAVLQAALDAGATKLIVYGDSRVVLDDVQTKTAGAPILCNHRTRAKELIAQMKDVTFVWIPRKKNEMADALSQQAVKLP
ncbi:MAG: ribonuclease HI family protein [Herminiimonas sp.]|uniref:ribonuclease HI family protein n=1 Tax=Herminiimonas sp. TaxID=1926289 RepID=UPI0027213DD7|nr:ribonuclease HI family protein [Herminiimonas sp.]MDO9419275.1 ribonuclease HI family protein [Herminiimonas sp.]